MRRAIAALLLGGALATFTAVPVRAAHAVDPLTLTVGTTEAVTSLDPRVGDGEIAREVWNLQYPTLAALDPATFEPEPGLASGWSPTPDGRGWRYTLRPMQWSDGKPVTADDVVYSLRHARDEHWPYAGSMLDGLDARKIDDHTVDVTSTSNSAALPGLLLHVVPAHIFEQVADIGGDAAAGGVGAGRWHLVSHDDRAVRLQAVDGPARPPIEDLVYRTYANDASLLAAIASGKVDAISDASNDALAELRAISGVTATHANDGSQYVAIANLEHGSAVLRNEATRRTIFGLIDRQKLVDAAVDGVGRVETTPSAARADTWQLTDTAAASSAAEGDGSAPIPPGTAITVGAPHDDPVARRIAGEIVRQLDAAGLAAKTSDDAPDIAIVRHDGRDDPTPVLEELTCSGGHLCDSQYDAMFEQFRRERDPATRLQLGRAMLQREFDHRLEVALLAPDTLQGFRTDRISGWLRHPEEQRLVVFAPSVDQYNQLTAATAPPGEDPGNRVLVTGAVVLGIGFVAAYLIAVLFRRRSRRTHTDVAAA